MAKTCTRRRDGSRTSWDALQDVCGQLGRLRTTSRPGPRKVLQEATFKVVRSSSSGLLANENRQNVLDHAGLASAAPSTTSAAEPVGRWAGNVAARRRKTERLSVSSPCRPAPVARQGSPRGAVSAHAVLKGNARHAVVGHLASIRERNAGRCGPFPDGWDGGAGCRPSRSLRSLALAYGSVTARQSGARSLGCPGRGRSRAGGLARERVLFAGRLLVDEP